ncbi:hypothetical protein SAMN05444167_3369 [Terriglobus roseus]|uniref:Uncharacterized protein n=1 Tax=Terriglobus roseus TaxID=392734 RepID=A0A1G7P2V7_9BACT|nr:hypothetical protein SAMN05444167_3369 [Terriglobus roseus]
MGKILGGEVNDQSFRVAVKGIFASMIIGIVTIASLLCLFFIASPNMFARWNTVVTMFGFLGSQGVMIWVCLSQIRLKEKAPSTESSRHSWTA